MSNGFNGVREVLEYAEDFAKGRTPWHIAWWMAVRYVVGGSLEDLAEDFDNEIEKMRDVIKREEVNPYGHYQPRDAPLLWLSEYIDHLRDFRRLTPTLGGFEYLINCARVGKTFAEVSAVKANGISKELESNDYITIMWVTASRVIAREGELLSMEYDEAKRRQTGPVQTTKLRRDELN